MAFLDTTSRKPVTFQNYMPPYLSFFYILSKEKSNYGVFRHKFTQTCDVSELHAAIFKCFYILSKEKTNNGIFRKDPFKSKISSSSSFASKD